MEKIFSNNSCKASMLPEAISSIVIYSIFSVTSHYGEGLSPIFITDTTADQCYKL